MVNGPDRVFIEKQGFLQQVQGVSIGEKSLMIAVKNIARRLGDDISESKPILDRGCPMAAASQRSSRRASGGVTLTISQVQHPHFEMEDLIRAGISTVPSRNHLEDYVLARKNILISVVRAREKHPCYRSSESHSARRAVLVIEDTAEIHLAQRTEASSICTQAKVQASVCQAD